MYLTAVLLLMNRAKYKKNCWADKERLKTQNVQINKSVLQVNLTEAGWDDQFHKIKKQQHTRANYAHRHYETTVVVKSRKEFDTKLF